MTTYKDAAELIDRITREAKLAILRGEGGTLESYYSELDEVVNAMDRCLPREPTSAQINEWARAMYLVCKSKKVIFEASEL